MIYVRVKYRTISNKYDRLEISYNQELSVKERIRNRLDDVLSENEQLRSVEMDYQRTKDGTWFRCGAVGSEDSETEGTGD